MLVAVSILALSLLIVLVYQRPPSTWLAFLTRLTQSAAPSIPEKAAHPDDTGRRRDYPKSRSRIRIEMRPLYPTFTLNEHESSDEDEEDNLPPPPPFPATNSAQRASKPPSLSTMSTVP
ncbi:unnamed protein product [Alternaria alternata]